MKLTFEQAVRSTLSSDSEVGSEESMGADDGNVLLLPKLWLGSTSWIGIEGFKMVIGSSWSWSANNLTSKLLRGFPT